MFNPLFPRGGYFGAASLIGPQNHVDLHPSVDIHVTRRITVSGSPELTAGAMSLGYARRLGEVAKLSTSLGIRGTANFIPPELEPFYGSRTPIGVFLYLHVRPNLRPAYQTPQHHARYRGRSLNALNRQ